MTHVGVDDKLRACDHVFAREFDGEMVLLDLEQGVYYGLDTIGTNVWKGVTGGKSVRELVTSVVDEYEVDEKQALQDLIVLATEWVDKQLLEPVK